VEKKSLNKSSRRTPAKKTEAERASRVGSVGAGRILQAIEIEHELAGFIEAAV